MIQEENMNQNAEVKAKKSIYIVWIIPFIAMAIATWMIYKHYDNKGYEITVVFENGSGIAIGKTPLIYNGIQIGKVTDLEIHSTDLSKVDVVITVDKKARGVAREGNVFWKVEPTVSLTEITGLSTILSGVYIGVMPSVNDPEKLHNLPLQTVFVASNEAPIDVFESGLLVTLHADDSDIKEGAPILYKKVVVGKVLDVTLKDKGVDYLIHINEKYRYLIKEKSKFWKISGLDIRASLAGIRVEMDSLASVIAGGISFNSPDDSNVLKNTKVIDTKVINKGSAQYRLYENKEEMYLENDTINLVSTKGYNIDIKAASVFFNGAKAGTIVDLKYNPSTDKTTFKIKLKTTFKHLANKDAYFWIVEPKIGLNSIEGLDAISRGPYISFQTSSKSKELKRDFILHENPPLLQGKHFKLIANKSYNLKNGVNVIHKDIVIGTLRNFKLSKNKNKVEFDIVIANKYKNLVNNSSSFYIQSAIELDASLDGLYLNIGSITSMVNGGIVLETKTMNSRSTRSTFTLFSSYKEYKADDYLHDGGKVFRLIANTLGSIKLNSPIVYKGIKVGKVKSYKLNKKTSKVELEIYIRKEYVDQINSSSSFYNVSGVQVKAGLDGLKIQTSSIDAIMRGGISFKTPLKVKDVEANHIFTLYKDEDAVDEKYVQIKFRTDKETGLKESNAIIYKSIVIGQVKSMNLVNDEVVIDALIKQQYRYLLATDSIFWVENVKINIDNIKNPGAIISGAFIKVLKGRSGIECKDFKLRTTTPTLTLNQKGIRVVATGSRIGSLKVGSPIFYRQVKIGSVESVNLSRDSKGVDLQLFIEDRYAYLVRTNSIFYNAGAIGVDVSLFGIKIQTETVATMIKGGINMVVPDDVGKKAKEMQKFKLYTTPDDDWLEYEPEIYKNKDLSQSVL
jgi:paraquat-inducible protein B